MSSVLLSWLLASACVCTSAWAAPAEDPAAAETQDTPSESPPLKERLSQAVRLYLRGEVDEARTAFRKLVADAEATEDGAPEVWAEALMFLGEIAYLDGDRDAADAAFRLVAQALPDHRPSSYDHPDEVVGAYEIVRADVATERRLRAEAARANRRPLPWWGYAPFGAPQFGQGRHARGAVYATLQVGLAAASIAAWVRIDQELKGFDELDDNAQIGARQRAIRFRDTWSIPTAAAFYVVWGISALDGGLSWRKDQRVPDTIGVVPIRGGAEVQVGWRF